MLPKLCHLDNDLEIIIIIQYIYCVVHMTYIPYLGTFFFSRYPSVALARNLPAGTTERVASFFAATWRRRRPYVERHRDGPRLCRHGACERRAHKRLCRRRRLEANAHFSQFKVDKVKQR